MPDRGDRDNYLLGAAALAVGHKGITDRCFFGMAHLLPVAKFLEASEDRQWLRNPRSLMISFTIL
jgi:hypothetical protein